MKIYFLILFVALLGSQAVDAHPKPSSNVPDCSRYEDGEKLPDINSCSLYYLCVGGQSLPQRCARGLYFDATSGLCNRAFLVECANPNDLDLEYGHYDDTPIAHPEVPCNQNQTPTPPPASTPCNQNQTPTPPPTPCTTTTCSTTTTCTTTTCTTTTCTTTTCTTTTCRTTIRTNTPCTTSKPAAVPCTTTKCTTTLCTTTACTTTPVPNGDQNPIIKPLPYLSSIKDCGSLPEGQVLLDYSHCRRYYVCTNLRAKRLRCRPGYWYDQDTLTCRPRGLVTNCAARRN